MTEKKEFKSFFKNVGGGGTRAANATIRYALTHTGADVRTIANTVMPNRF